MISHFRHTVSACGVRNDCHRLYLSWVSLQAAKLFKFSSQGLLEQRNEFLSFTLLLLEFLNSLRQCGGEPIELLYLLFSLRLFFFIQIWSAGLKNRNSVAILGPFSLESRKLHFGILLALLKLLDVQLQVGCVLPNLLSAGVRRFTRDGLL